ncbi:MAG: transketolase [Puniceicoccales bacterium]|jgi:transketolase|nr:transketolase [Puniceicoccales bacterium]
MNLVLQTIANESRGIAIDAIEKANSGHLGLPLGCAELGTVLFGQCLNYNPSNPRWLNRDRFVLSAGHGSIFLYTFLHLSGYPISLEDLKIFRQLGSKTPGHPEFGHTLGVEASTGPLGQGIGNAVGIALSQKKAAAYFNSEQHTIFDNAVVCLCGDGCLQEGVGQESVALAGHWGLDNLILFYDANQITLDAPLSASQTENVQDKFEAIGWAVRSIDGHDCEAIEDAYQWAKTRAGKPHLVILNTLIGKGLPNVEGTSKAHGFAGIKFAKQAKLNLGLNPEEHFFISEKTYQYFQKRRQALQKNYLRWSNIFQAWSQENPEKAKLLYEPTHLDDAFFKGLHAASTKPQATRSLAGEVLNQVSPKDPLWVSGSADLFESTKSFIQDGTIFQRNHLMGKNLMFGIREHAMGAILNGIAYDKIFKPCGSTFLAFSDYLKPALRVAALAHLPVNYFFSHDSIAVGEDGPTHQPIEHMASMQMIPNVQVFRPADYDEMVGCFQTATQCTSGPNVFILSKQDLPLLPLLDSQQKRAGTLKGAYVLRKEQQTPEYILIASGSEVQLALEVAKLLGPNARVVSMPSRTKFLQQSEAYQAEILSKQCLRRIFIEAGCSYLAHQFVGLHGLVIGIDQFGISAPQGQLFEKFGLTPQACYQKIMTHTWD